MRSNEDTLTTVECGTIGDTQQKFNPAIRRHGALNPAAIFDVEILSMIVLGLDYADARSLLRDEPPNLTRLLLDVRATAREAARLLTNDDAPLAVRRLTVQPAGTNVRWLIDGIGQHPSLRSLT